MRSGVLVVAAVMVSLGVFCSVTSWHREAAVPLLISGTAYAIATLAMNGRRHS